MRSFLSVHKAFIKAYLEPCQTSLIKLLAKKNLAVN